MALISMLTAVIRRNASKPPSKGSPEEQRVGVGAELVKRLIEQAVALVGEKGLAGLQLAQPAKVLRAIRRTLPNGQLELIQMTTKGATHVH